MNDVKIKKGGDKGSETFAYILPRDEFRDKFKVMSMPVTV